MDIFAKRMNNSRLIRIFLYVLVAVAGACVFVSLCLEADASTIEIHGRTLRGSTLAIATSDVVCALTLLIWMLCGMVILLIIGAGFGQGTLPEDSVTIELFNGRSNQLDQNNLAELAKSLQGDWTTNVVYGDYRHVLKEFDVKDVEHVKQHFQNSERGEGDFEYNILLDEDESSLKFKIGSSCGCFADTFTWEICATPQKQTMQNREFLGSLSVETAMFLSAGLEDARSKAQLVPKGRVLVVRGYWTDDKSDFPTTCHYLTTLDKLVVETSKKVGDELCWEIRVFERERFVDMIL